MQAQTAAMADGLMDLGFDVMEVVCNLVDDFENALKHPKAVSTF